MKQPQPDPALIADQSAAQARQTQTIQQSLSDQQLQMLRQFGQLNALSQTPGLQPSNSMFKGMGLLSTMFTPSAPRASSAPPTPPSLGKF